MSEHPALHKDPETLLSEWWLCFMETEEPAVTSKQTNRASSEEQGGWDATVGTWKGSLRGETGERHGGTDTRRAATVTADTDVNKSHCRTQHLGLLHRCSHMHTCFHASSPASVHMQKMYSLLTVSVWRVEHYILRAITHRDQRGEEETAQTLN